MCVCVCVCVCVIAFTKKQKTKMTEGQEDEAKNRGQCRGLVKVERKI